MSGRLSTPRDVKDVRFSRISGTSGNHPFNDENNRQFSHDNPRLTNYGDNNHQKFLTPNDIKRQYDYRRATFPLIKIKVKLMTNITVKIIQI